MIVAAIISDNRENEIAEAVRSVANYVDKILLVDTGITDGTVDRATEAADQGQIAIVIHRWTNFSDARNAAIRDARDLLGAEWVFIVDSDERIDFGDLGPLVFCASVEDSTADILLIESGDGLYPKEKLIRASAAVTFVGTTHEALIGGSRQLLRGVTFSELPKTDKQLERKFRRDVELLRESIKKDSDDPRWHYYLGVSLEGLGELELAEQSYWACGMLRKIGFEAAWAFYKQAEMSLILKRFERAVDASMQGMHADATFAECACIAATASVALGRQDQAVAWAKIAESVGRYRGYAPERLWFRHLPSLYELPYEILSAVSPNEADKASAKRDAQSARAERIYATSNIGNRDLDWLSVSRSASPYTRDEARAALRPRTLSEICPSANSTQISFVPPNGFLPTNPSICFHKGELWCVVRTVNYEVDGYRYIVRDLDKIVRTQNYLARVAYPYSLGQLIDPELMNDLDSSHRYESQIVGYEDVRLVSVKGRLTGSATVCDRDPEGRKLIARLDLEYCNIRRATVQHSNQLNEKNWMPLSVNDRLTWIYSLDPVAILPGPLLTPALKLDHLRGGAAMPFGDGFLCVTHEVIHDPTGRIYLHRFVRMSRDFEITSVSKAWVFSHFGIEFCAGIAGHDGRITLSYGLRDSEAWLVTFGAEELESIEWITT